MTQPSGGRYGYGGFGRRASGVISNADLVGNSVGMQMYKDLVAGKFTSICDYVSDRLDEEVNFNDYGINRYGEDIGKIVSGNGRK